MEFNQLIIFIKQLYYEKSIIIYNIVIVIYNNAPKLKGFRDKYNIGALLDKLKKHDAANIKDDKAKWDVVPTKIDMDEILSVDLKQQPLGGDTKKGDED